MGGARRVSPFSSLPKSQFLLLLLLLLVLVLVRLWSWWRSCTAVVLCFLEWVFCFFFPFTAVFFGVAAATSSCKHLVCCVFLEMVMVLWRIC
jgi:hypothetical protein